MEMLDNKLEYILFSEECTFTIQVHANRQNCRFSFSENSYWRGEERTQFPETVHFLGHLNGHLNGDNYSRLLQNNVAVTLANVYSVQGNPQVPTNVMWFSQDGASAHY